jgi:hypothetical protein
LPPRKIEEFLLGATLHSEPLDFQVVGHETTPGLVGVGAPILIDLA